MDGPHWHDETQTIGGGHLTAAPAPGERHCVLRRHQRGVGDRQRLGAQEVLLYPAEP